MAKSRDRIEMSRGVVRYFLNHVEVTQEEYEAEYPPRSEGPSVMPGKAVTTWRKPVNSISMGVLPHQIPEAMAEDKRRGVSVDYNADGTPKYNNRQQRREHLKAYGMIDRDSYTGY